MGYPPLSARARLESAWRATLTTLLVAWLMLFAVHVLAANWFALAVQVGAAVLCVAGLLAERGVKRHRASPARVEAWWRREVARQSADRVALEWLPELEAEYDYRLGLRERPKPTHDHVPGTACGKDCPLRMVSPPPPPPKPADAAWSARPPEQVVVVGPGREALNSPAVVRALAALCVCGHPLAYHAGRCRFCPCSGFRELQA